MLRIAEAAETDIASENAGKNAHDQNNKHEFDRDEIELSDEESSGSELDWIVVAARR